MQKKYFFFYLLIYLSLLTCVALTGYTIDPLQQFSYSKKRIEKTGEYSADYSIVAGRIKLCNFDTAICGTSTARRISKDHISNILHQKAESLYLELSSCVDQELAFELLYQYHPSVHIIYGLDFFSYGGTNIQTNKSLQLFAFKNDFWRYYQYFFSPRTYRGILKYLNYTEDSSKSQRNSEIKKGPEFSYTSTMNYAMVDATIRKTYDSELMKKRFDSFLQSVKKHPNIKFTIFYPPYSIVWWLTIEKFTNIDTLLEFKRYTVEQSSDCDNIEFYDFQTDPKFIANFDCFEDIFHTNPKAAELMIQDIKDQKNQLNSHNIHKIYSIKDIMNQERKNYQFFVESLIEKSTKQGTRRNK